LVAPTTLANHATSPITWVTGSFAPAAPAVVTNVRLVDGNTILTQITAFNLTGDLVGVYSGEERSVIRADGDFTQNAFRTFVGTLDGIAGTLEFREESMGNVSEAIAGQVTLLNGTGGLSGVRCEGTFEGDTASGTGTYALRCQ
jgi:hypothetical protein